MMPGFRGPLGSVAFSTGTCECFEVAKVFVVKYFKKDAIRVPGSAAAHEFAVCSSQGVEDGVVEFLVICNKVEFVGVNNVKRWASDCFGVVWKSFDGASIGK